MVQLTDREVQVLRFISQGITQREIAWQLKIKEPSVKSCLARIAAKYGFSKVRAAQLVDLAIIEGHLEVPSLVQGHTLTARQLLVLRLIAEGDDDKTIALKQHLATKTIKHEVSAILGKLGAKNRYHATCLGRQFRTFVGLITDVGIHGSISVIILKHKNIDINAYM